LFINVGKKQNIRKGDILGAITGETGLSGRVIGDIDVFDKYTFVEVPVEYAQDVQDTMKNVKIRGKSITIGPAIKKEGMANGTGKTRRHRESTLHR